MGMTAVLAAGGFAAATQVGAGNAQAKTIKKQSEYDASIYDQQAEMVKHKKEIQDYQFNREAARARGTIIAQTAGKGFQLSGSPLAILIDNETQMQFDKAIGDYNLDVEYNYAKSGATNTRESGVAKAKLARTQGYTNAFTTLLSTGVSAYGMSNPLAKKVP